MSRVSGSLFISYARPDSCFAGRLEADLQACNFSTWLDRRNIESDQPWKDILRNAIDHCDIFLLILSPASLLSSQVRMEYRYAQQVGKTLIALEYQTCVELPAELENIQHISFTADTKQGLQDLLIALSRRERVVPAQVRRTSTAKYRVTYHTPSPATRNMRRIGPSSIKCALISLYNSSMAARHARDMELIVILWQKIVQHDEDFRRGDLAIQLEHLRAVLRSHHAQYFRKQAYSAQNINDWRKAAGYWQALLEQDDQNDEARHALEHCLRAQGKKSSGDGDWEQAISFWKALLELKPGDAQAARQLALAQDNQEYAQYYQDAEVFIADNMLPLAKTMLYQLYDHAPYYGDPLGLARKAGIMEPIRSPMILEEEEEEKLARVQREKAKREAQERKNKEDAARLAEEQARRREEQAQEAAHQQALWKEEQARKQAQKAKEDEEKAKQLAAEQIKRWEPDWFIHHELETEPFVVWCSCFFLLSGSSSVVGILTQSWFWAMATLIVTMLVAYMLGHHRIVHRLPKRLQPQVKQEISLSHRKKEEELPATMYALAAPVIVVVSCFVTLGVMRFVVSPLQYNLWHVDHYLWISRTLWLGGQIRAGALIGAILSLILTSVFQGRENSYGTAFLKALFLGSLITFLGWIIGSSCALLFNLGWGLGSGWDVSLIGTAAGVAGGVGIGSSFVIWANGKPIF